MSRFGRPVLPAPKDLMKIKLDYHSSEPLYKQAVLQIKSLVVSGQLRPGDKLPSVRVLADRLQLNPTTVRRIFDQLAKEGVVVQRHGSGVFVSEAEIPFSAQYIRAAMMHLALAFLVEGLRFGLDYKEILEILKEQYTSLTKQGEAI